MISFTLCVAWMDCKYEAAERGLRALLFFPAFHGAVDVPHTADFVLVFLADAVDLETMVRTNSEQDGWKI